MSVAKNFSVSISYPPIFSGRKTPFLQQNRQFQWTNTGNLIYPVIPAYAATLLSRSGFSVFWDDAIAENLTYKQWLSRIIKRRPDLVVIETKTPVIKRHWQIIKDIKRKSLKIKNFKLKIVLIGDHVTALPEESLQHSPVDFVITGGDYDFSLLYLCRELAIGHHPPQIISQPPHLLNQAPLIDRQLTRWGLYARRNSNFKYFPGAYTMFSRDCWWGKCTFCSWTTLYPGQSYRCLSVGQAIAEVENLVKNFKVKEIFDDSGTFPVGEWLEKFCRQLIEKKLNQQVKISCNMRFGVLSPKQYALMAKAGFRMLLFGFESANQNTLDRLSKNIITANIPAELAIAKKYHLYPHLTAMVGYPWETLTNAQNTLDTVKQLFRAGLADSIQATMIIPYPGTPLFRYCRQKKLLLTTDWNRYDMSRPVIKSPLSSSIQKKLVNNLFVGIITPRFIFRQLLSLRSFDDIKHLLRYAIKFFKKLHDFS